MIEGLNLQPIRPAVRVVQVAPGLWSILVRRCEVGSLEQRGCTFLLSIQPEHAARDGYPRTHRSVSAARSCLEQAVRRPPSDCPQVVFRMVGDAGVIVVVNSQPPYETTDTPRLTILRMTARVPRPEYVPFHKVAGRRNVPWRLIPGCEIFCDRAFGRGGWEPYEGRLTPCRHSG